MMALSQSAGSSLECMSWNCMLQLGAVARSPEKLLSLRMLWQTTPMSTAHVKALLTSIDPQIFIAQCLCYLSSFAD